ncbi:hypothetical protein AH4AK4_3898 [Aeromonas hydrophila 4AK4]|nr:hypothetical protein AH4AK4_3898 [Aeromonas hydrophila 4AK4]
MFEPPLLAISNIKRLLSLTYPGAGRQKSGAMAASVAGQDS